MILMAKTGTKEWAEINKNFLIGCEHACCYCYARAMAERFKRVKNIDEWMKPTIHQEKFNEKPKNYNGKRIMFPTTHDILPEFIDETIEYLERWLKSGNEILIVSKPHFGCIKRICDELIQYKDQIIFRFTIGSIHDHVLHFWEPNAPDFSERLQSLAYAFSKGFKTSVSCEPFLDDDIIDLVDRVTPFVNDVIWIGKMNRISNRVDTSDWDKEGFIYLRRVRECQTDESIQSLYKFLKDRDNIRWKDSIKKVVGLPEEPIG